MKKYNLIINPFAEEDIKESMEWYNLQKEKLGEEFFQEIKKTAFSIKENPFQFEEIKNEIRQAIIKRFPFLMFFYIDGSTINIFAVFHQKRNPRIWKKRIHGNK